MDNFTDLYNRYASQEIDFETLKQIEASGIVRFENHGISRSNKNALLCKVYFAPLEKLLNSIISKRFSNTDDLEKLLNESKIDFQISQEQSENRIIYSSLSEKIELIADIATDGSICIDKDGVEACTVFNLFLHVQH